MSVYLGICQYEIWYPRLSRDILMQLSPWAARKLCILQAAGLLHLRCTRLASLKAADWLLPKDTLFKQQHSYSFTPFFRCSAADGLAGSSLLRLQ